MLKQLLVHVIRLLKWLLRFKFNSAWYQVTCLWDLLVHGYTAEEVMDLDLAFFNWFIPRIKQFRKQHVGHPTALTQNVWNRNLAKMETLAVKIRTDLYEGSVAVTKTKDNPFGFIDWNQTKEYRQFMYLFTTYLPNLWH